MRIKSVTVRNYRVHRDLTVHFDDSRTLIGGPNECGKSTLIEALHRGLFLKSTITGDGQKSMMSNSSNGTPEVEVTFTVGDSEYRVAKRFGGINGTTRLTRIGGETVKDGDAETQLASLLNVDEVGGGRGVSGRIAQQWSHLWVWQGQSGKDPINYANEQKDDLLHRLQQVGGAAAMQSELDGRVAVLFKEAFDGLFTHTGKPMKGSELQKADEELCQAEAERHNASNRVEKLRGAVQDIDETSQILARLISDRESLKTQQKAVDEKLSRVEELRKLESIQSLTADSAAKEYNNLQKRDVQILGLRGKIKTLESDLKPRNTETQELATTCENAKRHLDEAIQAATIAAKRTRETRLRQDFLGACVSKFEKSERLKELQAKEKQVNACQRQLTLLREELAGLPDVNTSKLKKLQTLESNVNKTEAALNAMAAGIDVLAAATPVIVGDKPLSAGQSQIVIEPTEISVGQTFRLRIHPGGGTSLLEVKKQLSEFNQKLREELDGLGIANVAYAAEVLAQRNDLSGKIKSAENTLEELHPEELTEALSSANEAFSSVAAEVDRRCKQMEGIASPATLAEAKQRLDAEKTTVEQAESEESQAIQIRSAAEKSKASAETALAEHRHSVETQSNELIGLQANLNMLLKDDGDDTARARKLAEALSAKNTAESQLMSTRTALNDLQPELLRDSQKRLKDSFEKNAETERTANVRKIEAQTILRLDGTDDPEAALTLAEARVRSAQSHQKSVCRKAEAIRLLNQLFLEEQRALADRFTKPFSEKISAYLQCLFGSGAKASITTNQNGFEGLQLVRPNQNDGATSFETLSGGAQEQVAAAVRLAMAEVLAADNDGCLPLVFDDAFAYSDPDRVQILQNMLYRAASHGLQIVVLTCNPSDYAGLGAQQINICPKLPGSAVQTKQLIEDADRLADNEESDPIPSSLKTEVPGVACTEDQRRQLLERLRALGGKAGNISLRDDLGWEDSIYNAVKDSLIADGKLIPGRGRGGSVALTENMPV